MHWGGGTIGHCIDQVDFLFRLGRWRLFWLCGTFLLVSLDTKHIHTFTKMHGYMEERRGASTLTQARSYAHAHRSTLPLTEARAQVRSHAHPHTLTQTWMQARRLYLAGSRLRLLASACVGCYCWFGFWIGSIPDCLFDVDNTY